MRGVSIRIAVVGLRLRRDAAHGQHARRNPVCAADEVIAERITVDAARIVCTGILLKGSIRDDVRVPVPEGFAVVSLLKSLRALHQCREQRHGLALVDAPRRTHTALGRNDGIAVRVLPIRVCRRQLHLCLGSDLDIRRHVSPTDG